MPTGVTLYKQLAGLLILAGIAVLGFGGSEVLGAVLLIFGGLALLDTRRAAKREREFEGHE